jgi:hypothetical protein
MGSTQTATQQLPADTQRMRGTLGNYLTSGVGKNLPAYQGDLKAPNQLMDVGAMLTKLLQGGLGSFSTGTPMPATGAFPSAAQPSIWNSAQAALTPMMQTGMPVSNDAAYQASAAKMRQDVMDSILGTNRQLSLEGSRYGTGAMRTGQDTASRFGLDFAAQQAEIMRQMEEAARQRQIQATQLGMQLGGQQTDWLSNLMNTGMNYSSAVQQSQQPAYNEWLRQQYANSPLLGAALSYGTNPIGATQTVNSTGFGSVLENLLKAGAQVSSAKIGAKK